ncbi:MAG: sigma-54 dependent transcriptional regulator [Candidatus Gracilibacteria bacterium]
MVGSTEKDRSGIEIVGMEEVQQLIRETISLVDTRVLLTGDTGTGKELVARLIHQTSRRVSEAFVAVNCGAIPEGLIESELFGHKKGSFTGAIKSRKGAFEIADRGTLFLDEVADLSQLAQVKVLRALQDGVITPVGSEKNKTVDVRVIAATNRDVDAAIRKGTLREDLFYRLAVIQLKLPSLRERVGKDFGELIKFFIKRYGNVKKNGHVVRDISAKAFSTLSSWSWGGNVRELENVIEHACVFCNGEIIEETDLPVYLRRKSFVKKDDDKKGASCVEKRMPVEIDELSNKLRKTLEFVGLKDSECQELCHLAQSNGKLLVELMSRMPKPKIRTLFDSIVREFLAHLKEKYENNVALMADRIGVSRQDMSFWLEGKTPLSELGVDCAPLLQQIKESSATFGRLCTLVPRWMDARRLISGLLFMSIFEETGNSKARLSEESGLIIYTIETRLRRMGQLCDKLQKAS